MPGDDLFVRKPVYVMLEHPLYLVLIALDQLVVERVLLIIQYDDEVPLDRVFVRKVDITGKVPRV